MGQGRDGQLWDPWEGKGSWSRALAQDRGSQQTCGCWRVGQGGPECCWLLVGSSSVSRTPHSPGDTGPLPVPWALSESCLCSWRSQGLGACCGTRQTFFFWQPWNTSCLLLSPFPGVLSQRGLGPAGAGSLEKGCGLSGPLPQDTDLYEGLAVALQASFQP